VNTHPVDRAWLAAWEERCRARVISSGAIGHDPAHDLGHVERVVANARRLGAGEGADPRVVIPAAWLHDCVHVPKHAAERPLASALAADAASTFLEAEGYPAELLPAIRHAIHAHSFSAGVEPLTVEARVVQDADRLDALGAIGIARTLMLGGAMGKPLHDAGEPIPVDRAPDDHANVIDHFFVKLLHLEARMRTARGRAEAGARTQYMRDFLERLAGEIDGADAVR
jgi:uncharacterized protein